MAKKNVAIVLVLFSLIFAFACTESIDDGNGKVQVYTTNIAGQSQKTFTSLFAAIDEIGVSGALGDFVLDASQTKVFTKSKRTDIYLYKKTQFVEMVSDAQYADNWLNSNTSGFAIRGNGSEYFGLSSTKMNTTEGNYGYELNTGAYVYQYSNATSDYYKITYTVKLSQAKLKLSENEMLGNNAYIFVNSNGTGGACDMGISSFWKNSDGKCDNGEWYLFYFGFDGEKLYRPFETPITVSKHYNSETGEYSGADDLEITYEIKPEGTYVEVKNLATKIVQSHLEKPSETFKDIYAATYKNRSLLHATSYVPYLKYKQRKLWDARCGGYLKNVKYEDLKIYKRQSEEALDFYPFSDTVYYGFAQGNDCASFTFSEQEKNVVHNICYDGSI